MVKLNLTISASSLECISLDEKTARVLELRTGGLPSSFLVDENEVSDLRVQVEDLLEMSKTDQDAFSTFHLVFRAPNAPTETPETDRTPVGGVFRSPMRAIHTSGELELCCFVHIEISKEDIDAIYLTAIEFSRKYREGMVRQEFGSWLLEEQIEKAVIATDPLGTVVFWNRFASSLYQYTKDEAIGKSIMDLTPSEMTQEQGADIFGRLVKGEHWKGFFGVRRKDSSLFVAHVTDTPILDQQGQLKFVVGVSADYTQMHNLMEELRSLNTDLEKEVRARTKELLEKENTLRMVGAAVKESDTGVIITDENFKIVWSNNAVHKMVNRADREILDTFPWDLPVHYQLNPLQEERDNPEDHRGVESAQHFFQSGQQIPIFAIVGCPEEENDEKAYLNVTTQAMIGSKQHMIILRDLTAERKADEAHRLAEKAAAASRTKTEMMQMLSHEFRTPLQGIMGVVSTILLDLKEDTALYDSLSAIVASSRLLLTLINNVLDLGKIDADKMHSIELSSLSVTPCIRDTMVFCEHFAKFNEVSLVLAGDPLERTVLGNRLRLEQILVNLISNAIKYSGSDTEVVISMVTNHIDEAVEEALAAGSSDLKFLPEEEAEASRKRNINVTTIRVRDQGRGIPQNEMGSLFGEFVQLEISKEKDRKYGFEGGPHIVGQSSGSGLGLNLVLKFVRLMDGHIWVKNCESGGAEFSFCLPQGDAPSAGNESRRATAAGPLSAHEPAWKGLEGKSFRVLLVDDSMINLKVLQRMLVRLGVQDIKIFNDGSKALDYLQSVNDVAALPNLILSDLQMPKMDGYSLIAQLREMAKYETPPLVMACTADWTPETEQKCLGAGFDGVLRKPIILSSLRDFLDVAFDDEFHFGQTSLSPETNTAQLRPFNPTEPNVGRG